jgi:putative phosphoesterase
VHLLLIADTHIPQRALDLPEAVWAEIDTADVVVHAGDWVSLDLLDQLQDRAKDLMGCWGNNDLGAEWRKRLPEVDRRTLDGVTVAVTHETGDKRTRDGLCDQKYAGTDLLVFGHSHVPWDSTTPGGIRLLNPGSCIDRRMQPKCTYMTLDLVDGVIGDVTLHAI